MKMEKACLTAYFTVNLSELSCVSHNCVFSTQLSSSSTASCMRLTSRMCIWFALLLSFQWSLPSALLFSFPHYYFYKVFSWYNLGRHFLWVNYILAVIHFKSLHFQDSEVWIFSNIYSVICFTTVTLSFST